MTLYDALMIYGKLADIFKIKLQESEGYHSKLQTNPTDSLTKLQMLEAKKYLVLKSSLIKLWALEKKLKPLFDKHITKFHDSNMTDVFSYKLEDEIEVKTLKEIFNPQMNESLMDNRFIKAAFYFRNAFTELLRNEKDFVRNCQKIRFDKLSEILQQDEQEKPNKEELLDLNHIAKNYYCIANSLQITIENLVEFCSNIFSICTFLHKKFTSEEFKKTFSAIEEIVKNYPLLLSKITNVQNKLDVKSKDYLFLADFQNIIIQPVQRIMRYPMTLNEIQKHCDILLSDEVDNLYIPLRSENGKEELSKELVRRLIPDISETIDTQVKHIQKELYMRECIEKIKIKKAEFLEKIDPKLLQVFFKEKNSFMYANFCCCKAILKQTKLAFRNKDYLSSHILKKIVTEYVEFYFGPSKEIPGQAKYKEMLVSFFEPLIKSGEQYYENLDKTENTNRLSNGMRPIVSLN